MEWTQEKINGLYSEIRIKSMTDEEFRKELLEDPDKVIEKMTGEKLPEGFKVNVIENDPAYNATFVLPDFAGDEMEEGELEQVSGGVVSFVVIVSACAAAIVPSVCAANACGAEVAVK